VNMMVNFNQLTNTGLPTANAAAGATSDAPATGFAALFAALQP